MFHNVWVVGIDDKKSVKTKLIVTILTHIDHISEADNN